MIRSFLLRLAFFGFFLLVGLEVIFRIVIPAAEMPAGHQDSTWGIMNLETGGNTEGRHSIGRLGRPAFHWQVNNFGFNSAYDYQRKTERSTPAVAVIGNSYVQGLYSDTENHLAGLLHSDFQGSAEVYNLGASGMPLSQAPKVAAFAQEAFAPELVILLAGSSSLSRSLRNNGLVPYCQQYRSKDGELTAVPPSTFRVNKVNRLLSRSALVRYLFYNANINLGGGGDVMKARETATEEAPGTLNGVPLATYDRILDTVFAEIRALTQAPVLLVFDADRQAMYDTNAKPARIRESALVETACRRNNIHFLDLTDAFWLEYRTKGQKVNFDDNYHWNPYGVRIVADEIQRALQAAGLVQGDRLVSTGSGSPDGLSPHAP